MAMSTETQDSRAAEWLKRLREAEAAEETLVQYTRRLGLKLGDAYRWKQHLRRTGQWPAHETRSTGKKPRARSKPRFARVRIAQKAEAMSLSVRLQVQLLNGRRAEMTITDEGQLSRVLAVLEQPL
jgi:hypothetical protein